MKKEDLIRALKKYGDHKDHCSITHTLRDNLAGVKRKDGGYPECSCGWTELIRSINSLYEVN